MSRKSLLVFSFLFFSAPLLAAEVLDFALVFKSLIQDKSLISGYRRTVFNQNIDLIGRVDPFLIPVYLEILNLPESDGVVIFAGPNASESDLLAKMDPNLKLAPNSHI